MKTQEIKISTSKLIGFLCSFFTILIFCETTINSVKISISSSSQLLASITIYIFFIFILSMFYSEHKEHRNVNINNYTLLIFVFFFTMIFPSLNSSIRIDSIKRSLILIAPSILILLITLRSRDTNQFFNGISLGTITITIISIVFGLTGLIADQSYINRSPVETITYQLGSIEFTQKIAHREFFIDDIGYSIQRFAGILPNPNGLGLLSAISFGLSYNRSYRKITRRILAAIFILGIALSFSRMGILLFTSITIYMQINSSKIRIITSAMLSALLILFLITAATSNKILSITRDLLPFQSVELFQIRERAHLFADAWQGFSENWLTGVGYGVGAEYLFAENAETQAVHSVHLNALLETGLLGTTTLLAIWLIPVFSRNMPRSTQGTSNNHSQVIAAILFGLFIAEAFDLSVTRFHYIHLIFFFLLGIWSSLRQEAKDAAAQNVQNSETQQLSPTTVEPNR